MENICISPELEEKIRQSENLEEVAQVCVDAGIQVTKEQLEAEMMPEVDGELSEEMLDNVSGGGIIRIVRAIINIFTGGNRSNFSSGGGGRGSFGGGGGGGSR